MQTMSWKFFNTRELVLMLLKYHEALKLCSWFFALNYLRSSSICNSYSICKIPHTYC